VEGEGGRISTALPIIVIPGTITALLLLSPLKALLLLSPLKGGIGIEKIPLFNAPSIYVLLTRALYVITVYGAYILGGNF